MKTSLLFIQITLFLLTSSQLIASELAPERESRNVKPFNSIEVSAGIDIFINQSNTQIVEVEAEKDAIHRIVTEVKGETLHIYAKGNFKWKYNEIRKVYISVPEIKSIKASSGSDVRGTNTINSDLLNLVTSSGADMFLVVNATTVKLKCSSGADMQVEGNTEHLSASCSSGAKINTKKLKAKYADVSVSSGAHIEVFATEKLIAKANSGGDINYSGSPKIKEIEKNSGGDVRGY
jgi:hypothetical protein